MAEQLSLKSSLQTQSEHLDLVQVLINKNFSSIMTLSSIKFTEKLELTKESELILKILYCHVIHSVNTHAHTHTHITNNM